MESYDIQFPKVFSLGTSILIGEWVSPFCHFQLLGSEAGGERK